jgi:hypothetical protein
MMNPYMYTPDMGMGMGMGMGTGMQQY